MIDLHFFRDSMEDQLRKMKTDQEAILESMRVQPPKYEFPNDSTDDNDLHQAKALPSGPSTDVVGPSSSSFPPRGGKGSMSAI